MPQIESRAALGALRPFVIGFVQRTDAGGAGASLQLPFAIPVVHIVMAAGRAPSVLLSVGTDAAEMRYGFEAGTVFVVALGFRGAAMLAPSSPSSLFGRFWEIDDAGWRSLAERLPETVSFMARADLVEAFLLDRVLVASPRSSPMSDAADAIAQDRWWGKVSDLADRLGMEERTLRTRFRQELGWSPKRLLSVSRFTRAVRAIHPRPWSGRARDDVKLEFFDDAHFYHQFQAHAGISPADYAASKRRTGDSLVHNLQLPLLPTGEADLLGSADQTSGKFKSSRGAPRSAFG